VGGGRKRNAVRLAGVVVVAPSGGKEEEERRGRRAVMGTNAVKVKRLSKGRNTSMMMTAMR
jgi:hypothetical protein